MWFNAGGTDAANSALHGFGFYDNGGANLLVSIYPNAQGPSHILHGRLECWTCHATWHAQQFSRQSIVDYNTDAQTADRSKFLRRGYSDNEIRNAFQAGGEASFMTSADELILGINHKGKIQNFDPAGLDFLWANKVASPNGTPTDGNFLELSRCEGGQNHRGLCEVDSDCTGGRCLSLTCSGGPRDGKPATAEGQCRQCLSIGVAGQAGVPAGNKGTICLPTNGASFDCGFTVAFGAAAAGGTCTGGFCTSVTPLGRASPEDRDVLGYAAANPSCTLDTDCGDALADGGTRGKCSAGTLSGRLCFGGPNDGKSCNDFDAKNPTASAQCPSGTCGVRMFNFAYSTIDNNLHLPSFAMQPLFPHTVRKIPRNCDSCHPSLGVDNPFPTFGMPHNLDLVLKAIGLGTGTARATDPGAPKGFRDINISRRVRILTNGKGELSIPNPETGRAVNNGDEILLNLDEFIQANFGLDRGRIRVNNIQKTRPTPHVGTGPLDAAAIEKIVNTWVSPQIPSPGGP